MYVITFYSFKGGVGRTMALANVGVELAQRGRRVLLVDFDLEAPGLDTLPLPRPTESTLGIVDYVSEFLETGRAAPVENYLYEASGVAKDRGGLWIMPAGRRDESYSRKLGAIDWLDLYHNRDGYLMLEDMKAQWKDVLAPDYVLIDSRTGHTDVAGICTRQLPDAVVILFFPNDQNLSGLTKIVADIRAEQAHPRNKQITLEFVMSNVPDLDDEEDILKQSIETFERALRIPRQAALHIVHRYDSLLLLKQVVFTRDKPRSRLAREYQSLTDKLVKLNPEDREGALDYLRDVRERVRTHGLETVKVRLERIAMTHASDAEVMFALARVQSRQREPEEALTYVDKALALGVIQPEAFLLRAEANMQLDNRAQAAEDALGALRSQDIDAVSLITVVNLLRTASPSRLPAILDTQAIRHLSWGNRLALANHLSRSRGELDLSLTLLSSAGDTISLDESQRRQRDAVTAMTLIGLGRCDDAERVLVNSGELTIQNAFNLATANWGSSGRPDRSLFARVIAMDAEGGGLPGANYQQCLALASYAVGDEQKGRRYLAEARRLLRISEAPTFSCWQYLTVAARKFLEDCSSIGRLIDGGAEKPPFLDAGRPGVS